MTTNLIIGSGPAAAGAALALAEDPRQQITVVDVGHQLELPNQAAVKRLASAEPSHWESRDLELVTHQPIAGSASGLPEKRAYGSDFPFSNRGQLDGIDVVGDVNASVVSGAYGGLSNVWGSQVMVFTPETFDDWPISFSDMEPHYREILDHIPYAAEDDALAARFPLVARADRLPDLAPRTTDVLRRSARHHARLSGAGILVGRARLAFRAPDCIRCGMCMTGCPHSLIY